MLEASTPKRLAPEARRAQILDVALAAFERVPLDTISFETLAPEVGVSPALLRHYFGTRRDLFIAAVEEIERQLTEVLGRDRTHIPLEHRWHRMLDDYLHYVETNRWAHRVWMSAASDPDTEPIVDRTRKQITSIIIDGPIDKVPAKLRYRAYGWFGLIETIVARYLYGNDPIPRAEVLETIIRSAVVLEGDA